MEHDGFPFDPLETAIRVGKIRQRLTFHRRTLERQRDDETRYDLRCVLGAQIKHLQTQEDALTEAGSVLASLSPSGTSGP